MATDTWFTSRNSRPLAFARGSANVSDFRQAGLKRKVLNFCALNPCVAVCRFVQLYESHGAFIL